MYRFECSKREVTKAAIAEAESQWLNETITRKEAKEMVEDAVEDFSRQIYSQLEQAGFTGVEVWQNGHCFRTLTFTPKESK